MPSNSQGLWEDYELLKTLKQENKQNRTKMADITNPYRDKEKGASVMFTKGQNSQVFRALEKTSRVEADPIGNFIPDREGRFPKSREIALFNQRNLECANTARSD